MATVVNALANGLRSEAEIARSTQLDIDRVRVALSSLVADKFVIESRDTGDTLFRLLDNGQDMLKGMRTAERTVKLPGAS